MNMPGLLKKIEDEAISLSTSDRARLVQTILESLHADDAESAKAWTVEIDRRVEAFDRGELTTHPAEDVFAEVRRVTR